MLNVFTLVNGRLVQEEIDSAEALGHVHPVWVDLEVPTADEKAWVHTRFGISIPDDIVDDDLEESARFYEEDNGELHIRSDFLIDDDVTPRNVRRPSSCFSRCCSRCTPKTCRSFACCAARPPHPGADRGCQGRAAQALRRRCRVQRGCTRGHLRRARAVGAGVLKQEVDDQAAGEALAAIAKEEDLNGRIRRNVMDTRRAVSFMMRSRMLNAEQFEEARQILRDIDSLDSHTAFLFDKINFLLDATVGFININQNKIIKIFSVASVALLPPTLIASLYGMNFRHMPELDWAMGYPFAIGLMAVSVAVPLFYFRRKGWLR
jgi:magnesium transporter